MTADNPTTFFWELAEPLLAEEAITKSTMMGFPCLRVNGDFFASADHKTGNLIIKLSAKKVDEMIESGLGDPFAPAGRRFKEWVMISDRDPEHWHQLIAEARTFVGGKA